jgi:hypothetical protein
MPTKLKILIALIAVFGIVNLAQGAWLAAAFDAVLLLGLFKGSEGMRNIMMLLGWLGIALASFLLFFAVMAAFTTTEADLVRSAIPDSGAPPRASVWIGVGVGMATLATNAFYVWCLSRADVQHWMFRRAAGSAFVEEP